MERTPDSNPVPNKSFDDIVSGLEISPETTIESQQELLKEITQRHKAAQQEAGITLVAIDHLPLEAIGTQPEINLRRVKPSPDTEMMFLRVSYEIPRKGQLCLNKNIFLNVAEKSIDGNIVPQDGFDMNQAELVFHQAAELQALQKEGFLPRLSADLGSIDDLRSAMMLAPTQPKANS